MIYLLLAIGVLLTGGLVVLLRVNRKDSLSQLEEPREVPSDCCGAHEICESESLLTIKEDIDYFNDEELDEFKGLMPEDYTDPQIEEFRDVLYTLQSDEVAGWLRSMQLRGIHLPDIIREEALMVVTDFRKKRQGTH